MLQQLSTIMAQVAQCSSIEGLLSAEKHLLSAKTCCKITSSSESGNSYRFPSKNIGPANKNITPQRPFSSTKRKTKNPTIKLAKPSTKEKEAIVNALFTKNPLYETTTTTTPLQQLSRVKTTRKAVSGNYHKQWTCIL